MKIDLNELYKNTVNEFRGHASKTVIEQEFLFALKERGEEFLKTVE